MALLLLAKGSKLPIILPNGRLLACHLPPTTPTTYHLPPTTHCLLLAIHSLPAMHHSPYSTHCLLLAILYSAYSHYTPCTTRHTLLAAGRHQVRRSPSQSGTIFYAIGVQTIESWHRRRRLRTVLKAEVWVRMGRASSAVRWCLLGAAPNHRVLGAAPNYRVRKWSAQANSSAYPSVDYCSHSHGVRSAWK